MVDPEVQRLRKLRAVALRTRAVAKAMAVAGPAETEVFLNRTACAAWRVARAVSGRLRAHPYIYFQKDPSVAALLSNSLSAKLIAIASPDRARILFRLDLQLTALARELDDARALTWASELSDSFGRSQVEIRSVLGWVEREAQELGIATLGTRARDRVAAARHVESTAPAMSAPVLSPARPMSMAQPPSSGRDESDRRHFPARPYAAAVPVAGKTPAYSTAAAPADWPYLAF